MWRYTVVAVNVGGLIWIALLSWDVLSQASAEAWRVANMQLVTSFAAVAQPRFDPVQGMVVGAGIRRTGSRATNGSAPLYPRRYQEGAECDAATCEADEIWWTSDYTPAVDNLSFLGVVHVPVLSVVCLWLSVSYAVFSLPNESQYTLSIDGRGNAPLYGNRVVQAVFLWNVAGCVALYCVTPTVVPLSTALTATAILVQATVAQALWVWVGHHSQSLLFSGVFVSGASAAKGDSPERTSEVHYWVHLIKLYEAAQVFPLLLVLVMSQVPGTAILSDLQYTYSFAGMGLALLIAQELVSCVAAEQISFNVLAAEPPCASSAEGRCISAGTQQCVDVTMRTVRAIMPRITLVAVGMLAWGLGIYYNAVGWWCLTPNADAFNPLAVWLARFLPAYGALALALSSTRAYMRLAYAKNTTQQAYMDSQRLLTQATTVAWDVFSSAGKLCACYVLTMRAHSGFP